MISWALRRLGADLESLASPKVNAARLSAWERGDEFPSEGQAEALADRLGIAYAMLFMPEVPPDERPTLADLRTLDGRPVKKPSINFLKVLDTTAARQDWYREENPTAKPLLFIAKFSAQDGASAVAEDMRAVLRVSREFREGASNYEEFLKLLIEKAENAGVLVMRSSLVGHATKRSLNVKEFRGFALVDSLAPIVFINDADAKAAQIFTFAHELAHLWVGAPGISDRNPNVKDSSKNAIELLCDHVAAEFLVPEREFLTRWSPARTLEENMRFAERYFRVSSLVVLRRAKDLSRITFDVFLTKIEEQYDFYRRREAEKRKAEAREGQKKKRGGNFWASFDLRNSAKFNAAVVASIRAQRTTFAEAGVLFGITPAAAARYVQRLGTTL